MASFSTLTERINITVRLMIPYAFMAVLFLLNVVAVPYPLSGFVKAPLFLAGIYYWAIYRPTLIPPWLAFIAGCLMDILSGLPIGMNALVFVATHWTVADQRRFLMGQSFVMIWIGFSLLVMIVGVVQWILFGLVNLHWLPPGSMLMSSVLGVVIFPLISIILHLTHKILPAPHPSMRFNSQS